MPPDLNQTFSAVRMALADCMQTMTQLGLPLPSTDLTPNKALEEFRRLDKKGNIDQILQDLVPKVPVVLQAKAALEQARHDLEQAELNLRYCDIVSEIDGVVTGRNVNPGNTVQAGQSLMAVRSLTEIWIDANFKETQLADLRIGQRVRCEVDMYGSRQEFEGRITGFTMGTGQTLSLLPPQNATGNFVKIVQRLPVRVELTDYDPDKAPLFVGLSVTPYVYYKEPPTGPHAGDVLQPLAAGPTRAAKPESMTPTNRPYSPTEQRAEGEQIMSSMAVEPHRRSADRRSTTGSSPASSSCPRSWRSWTPRSRTWPCGTWPAACPPRRPTPSGSSPATWPPTPSSCRSPAGCRPTSAAATTSCCRSPSLPSPRQCAASPPACRR